MKSEHAKIPILKLSDLVEGNVRKNEYSNESCEYFKDFGGDEQEERLRADLISSNSLNLK